MVIACGDLGAVGCCGVPAVERVSGAGWVGWERIDGATGVGGCVATGDVRTTLAVVSDVEFGWAGQRPVRGDVEVTLLLVIKTGDVERLVAGEGVGAGLK